MPLQVQLLPTSAGDSSQVQPLTSYLVNGTIAIDAGSLGLALPGERLAKIEHIVLTHSHLDHTASLPIAIDSAYTLLQRPMRVYGAESTLAAVRKNLFNDEVWVDFSQFKLLNGEDYCMQWMPMAPRKPLVLDGVRITPIPVNHLVPTLGLIIESENASIVITSDTWKTDEIWAEAARLTNLRAVFIECSFPDEMDKLAKDSGHLTPRLVAEETAKIGRPVPVYCVHLKPSMRDKLQTQLAGYKSRGITPCVIGHVYEWK
jgi:ribonuclease BN (tRNA processing enzyme)